MNSENNNTPQENNESVIVELPLKNSKKKKSFSSKKSDYNGPRLSPLALGIIAAIILIIIYIIADISSGGFIYTVNGKFQSVLTKSSSQNYAVEINADSVFDFEAHGDGFMLLTENGVSFVEKNGELISGQQMVYSTPLADVNGKNIVIYDKGNSSYTLMHNRAIISQQKLEDRIVDFAVSKDNNYAIVLRDDSYKTVLIGCNSKGKIIYQWNCSDGYITDVAINDNGNKVAVSVINSTNAVLSSHIYILDFEYDSAYAEFEYTDETVIGAKFLTDRKIQVITDKNVYRISGKNQTVSSEYGTQDIICTDFSEEYTAVITKDYSHDDTYILSLFKSNGKLKYSVTLNGKVTGLSISDKSVAVLFSDKIETYSKSGKLVGSITDTKHYDGIVINKNFIYVLSSDTVRRFPAYGNMSYEPQIVEDETHVEE